MSGWETTITHFQLDFNLFARSCLMKWLIWCNGIKLNIWSCCLSLGVLEDQFFHQLQRLLKLIALFGEKIRLLVNGSSCRVTYFSQDWKASVSQTLDFTMVRLSRTLYIEDPILVVHKDKFWGTLI